MWIEESDEPNPNYKNNKPGIPSSNALERLPSLWEIMNQPEPIAKVRLNSIKNIAIAHEPHTPGSDDSASFQHADTPEEKLTSDQTESTNPLDTLLLDDVSFDQILPSSPTSLTPNHDTSPNHSLPEASSILSRRALIRPDHVRRLPHLNAFRKSICQHQVDELYHTLKAMPMASAQHSDALSDLEALSRTLLKDVRDWRQTETLAPQIRPSF